MIQKNHSYYLKSKNSKLRELGECGGALTTLMKFLLEEGMVDGVLAVKKAEDVYDAVPVLITDPEELGVTASSLHCGTHNIANILVKYLYDGDKKLAVTVKPCEARSIIEIADLGKIDLKNILLIGVNCGGTFAPIPTINMVEKAYGVDPDLVINEEISHGQFIIETPDKYSSMDINHLEEGSYGRRSNCRRCDWNIPSDADLAFGNWGTSSTGDHSFVEVFSKRGAAILAGAMDKGYLSSSAVNDKSVQVRNKINDVMVKLARKWQINDFYPDERDIMGIFSLFEADFDRCIKCMGCRDACPLCYCQECSLNNTTQEWADQGKIPPSPLFHLERLIHMVESCTNCGQCEDVCPAEIPLANIWHQVNLKIKELKKVSGIRLEDHLLFKLFRRPE